MIKLSKCGSLARVKKQNEIIKALNPLLRLEMRYGDKLQTHYSENNVVLEIPNLDALSQALEDIQSEVSSHPWKVTSNTDGTVTVAAGELLSFDHEALAIPGAGGSDLANYFNLEDFASYAGGSVTVTGAGVIYAKAAYAYGATYSASTYADGFGDDHKIWLQSVSPNATVTVHYASAMPTSGDDFHVKLAEVSVAASVISVNKQIITHNPTLFMPQITGNFSANP
jgi:hypothetical protein